MADEYLKTPLVVWIQTFSIETITYNDIIDGYFLNEVFQQIDSKCSLEGIVGKVEDVNDRIQNWEMLLKNVRSFYQEVLQQYIILKPPDIFLISYHPDTAAARDHIDTAILLLLGCAVQCEERESHVEVIKGLHVDVQHSIMQHIKEVTDFSKAVLNVNIPLKDIDDSTLTLYTHLSNLINQRDAYIQEIKNLHQALNVIDIDDYGRITLDGQWGTKARPRSKSSNRLSLINLEMSNLVGQAEYKAAVRKLKQEILDKGDLITELEDEMDLLKKNLQKLKIENFDLTQQARMGKFYRDELDIYKEKAEVVEKLEKEVQKHKDQMVEFDYLKDRVEELQVDNCILMDSKKVLENQVEELSKKSQLLFEAELELAKYKKALEESSKEQEEYKERVKFLNQTVENFEREREAKKRISFMEDSLHAPFNFDCSQDGIGSLADQLLQASQSQIIALEAKLQTLELEMKDKFYFSENVLKAFDLDKGTIKSDFSIIIGDNCGKDNVDGVCKDIKPGKACKDGGAFLTREDLEREVLKRLALLKDDNDRLKTQSQAASHFLELNQEKIKALESSNAKLSSEKHQLMMNVESGNVKVKNLLEERDRLESELLELKKMADVCLKRTRDLEDCLEEVKMKDEAYLQEKIEFEKESKRLKSLLKDKSVVLMELENNINEMNVEVAELRKISKEYKQLEATFLELKEEVENLNENKDLDKKLIMSLREELVGEKISTQSLREELSRINKKCEAFTSGELVPPKLRVTEKLLEEKVIEGKSLRKKITELEEGLEDRKVQMEKLQSELNSLLKKEELSATKDRTLIVTQRYGQSPGATQEILKLKDSLSKTQKQRDSLLQEVSEMRKQVDTLRSALDQQPQDDSSYVESLQDQLQKNQLVLANYQVEHSTILTQNATLESQVAQLKLSVLENLSKVECLTSERNSMEDNCRALQKLHDKLGVEFERLQEDHGTLKGVHRLLKTDLKSAREKISSLEKNLEKMKGCSTNEEVTTLKEENSNLMKAVESLENDNKSLSIEMRKNRVEVGRLKDILQGLQRQLSDNRNIMADLNIEIERLRRIEHMYNRAEEENMILTDQLRMYKTSLDGGNDTSNENHQQQQQKSLIERLSEMKGKSTKSENQALKTKKKSKNELTSSVKNHSCSIDSKSAESESLASIRKDAIAGSPIRKSQEDFISIETTPTQSESKTVSPFETITKFGDWRIKTVFRKNKSVDSAQQTSGSLDKDATVKKKSKRNIGTGDVDDETITLNQFLSECNQSPKSRRKFLIQKRVALDDNVFCDRELSMDPRPPILFESSRNLTRCGRSEGSIFNIGHASDRNATPQKSQFERSDGHNTRINSKDAISPDGLRNKTATYSKSLHHSKSLQEQSSEQGHLTCERQKVRNELYGDLNSGEGRHGASKLKKSNFVSNQSPGVTGCWTNVDHSHVLRRKDSRELQSSLKKRTFTAEGSAFQGVAVEDVPYQPSDGVVKNLIMSYQKNSESPVADEQQNSKETNFSRANASQSYALIRPKSAGPNQERAVGRRFYIDQSAEGDNHSSSGNPKVCLVRPATASNHKIGDISPHNHTRNANGRNNGESLSFPKSSSSNKSKALYEYSCV